MGRRLHAGWEQGGGEKNVGIILKFGYGKNNGVGEEQRKLHNDLTGLEK